MRSLLIASAMCAMALTFTGCSFTVSGPCTSLTHQSRLRGCGCMNDECCQTCTPGPAIQSCQGQPECPCTDCCDNGGVGVVGSTNRPGLLSRMGSRNCDGDCGPTCPADCGCEGGMRTRERRPAGGGLFSNFSSRAACGCESGTDCSCDVAGSSMGDCGCGDGACDGGCGRGGLFGNGMFGNGMLGSGNRMGGMSGGMMGGGNNGGLLGSHARGGKIRGCGRFGCGRDGKLCLTCHARKGLGHGRQRSTAGEIPHTAEPPMMGPGAPQYVYPYYTTRGPRDFLMKNPPSIGY